MTRWERGTFWWCIERFDLGDRKLTVIARIVCRTYTVWPEQLVGRDRAEPAVSRPDAPPLATGHSPMPLRKPRAVDARRHAWCLGRIFTDLSAAELGEAFGGYSASTVRKAWRHADEFDLAGLLLIEKLEAA